MDSIANSVIAFTGIFSAILITFIVSKVFQIRQEKLSLKSEIIVLSNKITDIRRIARILKDSTKFWKTEMKSKLDNKYKIIDYTDLHSGDELFNMKYPEKAKLIEEYIKDTEMCGGDFYLSLRSIVYDHKEKWQLDLFDKYDNLKTYSLDLLVEWMNYSAINSFWYYFDHKYDSYKDCFNFSGLFKDEKEEILHLCCKINQKEFSEKKFDNTLLATVGNEVSNNVLPKLYELTYECNLALPKSLIYLISLLNFSIIIGIVIPLISVSIELPNTFKTIITYMSLFSLIICIVHFVLYFKKILNNEIKILNS